MGSIKKYQGIPLALLISISLMAYSCGGGGGGTGAPANAKAAAAATKSVISAFAASSSGTSTGSTLKPASGVKSNAKTIRKGILGLKTRLQSGNSRQKTLRASSPATCLPGGSGTVTSTTTSFTETYINCDKDNADGTITRKNGTLAVTFAENSFSSTFKNFEESTLRSTDLALLKYEKTDGTFVMSGGTLTRCNDEESFFNNAIITINATFEEKADENGDHVLERDETFTGTHFRMTISESFDATSCSLTQDTIVMNGAATFTDNLHPASDDNFTATFTGYTITEAERKVDNAVVGDQLTLAGTIALTSPCATGTYTMTTEIPLFFPTGAECPVEGKVLVVGGGLTTAVTATPTGGVTIDEGNDGTIDKSFDTCNDTAICS